MRLGNEYLTTLKKLLCVVIDEADRMLESGHFEELENILRALPVVDPNSKRRKQIRLDNGEVMVLVLLLLLLLLLLLSIIAIAIVLEITIVVVQL